MGRGGPRYRRNSPLRVLTECHGEIHCRVFDDVRGMAKVDVCAGLDHFLVIHCRKIQVRVHSDELVRVTEKTYVGPHWLNLYPFNSV